MHCPALKPSSFSCAPCYTCAWRDIPGRSEPASTLPDSSERLREALSGRYTIEREIGRGGMATVYLARDQRHDRKVALKVLLPELGAVLGTERFLGEIRVTANLQHPHLLPLFDSGEAAGQLFYVMPFVQGESLRDRLDRERQLPIDAAVRIASQVASALDYAHRNGVIHRDLKPENILLHDGQAVVADFGIALAVSNAGGARVTQTGLSLGTPQYMSPEQAAGDRVLDGRTDVYALAALTYEMLVGDPPHDAGSVQAIIAKVLTEKPAPVRSRRDTVPVHVDAAIQKALAKLPADRFPAAGEFADALVSPRPELITAVTQAGSPRPLLSARRAIAVGAAATALALLGLLAGRLTSPRAEPGIPSRLGFDIFNDVRGAGTPVAGRLALTPDGSAVVVVTAQPSGNMIHVRRLDTDTVMVVAGSSGAENVVVSSDGTRLLFDNGRQSQIVPIEGGMPLPAPGVPVLWFTHWRADGALFYSLNGNLSRVPATGGTPTVVAPVDSLGRGFFLTDMLPDGRTALGLLISTNSSSAAPLMAMDVETKRVTQILSTPVYEGHYGGGVLLWARDDGSVYGALFDPERKALIGPEVSLGFHARCFAGFCQMAVADNGTIAYVPRQPTELVLVGRDGKVRRATDATRDYHGPRFSSDGRIAVDFTLNGERDVWILDADQRTLQRATFSRDGHDALWDATGRAFTYLSAYNGPLRMLRTGGSAAGRVDSVSFGVGLEGRGVWINAPRAMVATWFNALPGTGQDVVLLQDSTANPMRPLVASRFAEGWPDLSPNRRWLAFTSNESGREEVYVQPLSGDGERIQVSVDGGSEPIWSPNAGELFYRGGASEGESMIAARIETSPRLRVGSREVLFASREYDHATPHANYDVSPDGNTFVMIRRPSSGRIVVIQNVPELVRRLSQSTAGQK